MCGFVYGVGQFLERARVHKILAQLKKMAWVQISAWVMSGSMKYWFGSKLWCGWRGCHGSKELAWVKNKILYVPALFMILWVFLICVSFWNSSLSLCSFHIQIGLDLNYKQILILPNIRLWIKLKPVFFDRFL